MKRKIICLSVYLTAALLCVLFLLLPVGRGLVTQVGVFASGGTGALPASVAAVDISAKAAVVIEAASGRVLWEKNASERLPMASTTKIMTAWLTLLRDDLDVEFTVDSEAIRVEGSSMGLVEGDTVTLRGLAAGMLSVSGNDAANAAAVRIAGTVKRFVALMNDQAAAIGLTDTHFVTPSGLDADEHYSTALDMALLAAAALDCENFSALCSSRNLEVRYGNPPYLRNLVNSNRLLRSYDGAIGVKTGFTTKAGRCLVSAAQRDGVRLICVTLHAPDDWQDHTKLLDYGFSAVERVEVVAQQTAWQIPVTGTGETVTALCAGQTFVTVLRGESDQIVARVQLPEFLFPPVRAGQVVGQIEYHYNGRVVARAELVTAGGADVPENESGGFWDFLRKLFGK